MYARREDFGTGERRKERGSQEVRTPGPVEGHREWHVLQQRMINKFLGKATFCYLCSTFSVKRIKKHICLILVVLWGNTERRQDSSSADWSTGKPAGPQAELWASIMAQGSMGHESQAEVWTDSQVAERKPTPFPSPRGGWSIKEKWKILLWWRVEFSHFSWILKRRGHLYGWPHIIFILEPLLCMYGIFSSVIWSDSKLSRNASIISLLWFPVIADGPAYKVP